jgi:hypothetical protein
LRFTVSVPLWALAALLVTGIVAAVWLAWPSPHPQPHVSYGGTILIRFVPTASASAREAALARCVTLPGVEHWSVLPSGMAEMAVPPAGESGVSPMVQRRHERERQQMYACLKVDPLVASTTEGL